MNKDTESLSFDHSLLVYDVIDFKLIKGIFTKTMISPYFRKADNAKSEVQCIVKISTKVFKVLFHTSNIDMKNRNYILREVFKTFCDFRGRVILSVKRRNALKEISIRVYFIVNRIIFY